METGHIVKAYDKELERLDNLIAEMGGLAETQLTDAVQALVRRDEALAAKVVVQDQRIDAIEADIDAFAMRLLALRQPKADDLRVVIAGLKTAVDLERIGDYAKNIAKRAATLTQAPPVGTAAGTIARMAGLVQGMIKDVLDAYIARDADRADLVRARDEEVDQLHTSLFRELLTYMMEDARSITPCTHLLFVAKNVERMGDHATNIAEHVHFVVRGQDPADERPKGDETSTTLITPKKKATR